MGWLNGGGGQGRVAVCKPSGALEERGWRGVCKEISKTEILERQFPAICTSCSSCSFCNCRTLVTQPPSIHSTTAASATVGWGGGIASTVPVLLYWQISIISLVMKKCNYTLLATTLSLELCEYLLKQTEHLPDVCCV